ncbi:MAG TPA: ATP-binding protein [Ginsengibacter sp.]|nr:ATP-binding protein [Ginsengibacter sp.]
MDNNKDLSETERTMFLEGELKRLEKDLAQKIREIEVEKALEMVRVKALDMRNSAELSQTSTILFQQLKELKIDAIRSGVGIFDDEANAIELWITSVSDDGEVYFILDYINIHVHPVFENVIESRKAREPFAVINLEGKELLHYYKTMSTYTGIPNRRENIHSEYFYSFFFSAGTINVVTGKALTDEELNIMLRVANAFGLIYTRFLDLKRLEEQAILIKQEKKTLESTLDNLKATQSQLIQSEKMASLGELTAGIAHEIQNPLNFVNNFSEVNKELIEEMKTEMDQGNIDEAKAIANDITHNEEKINHHGKRADAIVKGMLQHSRANSGQKELTDINVLADEYLRLSYHGLRAKDKTFNATMETDFDTTIDKINAVPQDIGRVLLNLFNNSFYATKQRQKTEGKDYKPIVSVKTQREENSVYIAVSDNGNGIPHTIIDKIFQPFFTTKPTGEGTGLGLSLSYDIIKAHNGDLKATPNETGGSTFTIQLPIT